MFKTLALALNKYPSVPQSLRLNPANNVAKDVVEVDPARLYHHFYLDTRGYAPINPDPAQFTYLDHLTPTQELRCVGDGFGIGTAYRRSTSNQLGQAFCRWFLYDHLKITYFAHMDEVLDRAAHKDFGGYTVKRVENGDAPDYLCSQNISMVYLAEAKGRTSSISFGSADFQKWRKQFDRVVVQTSAGVPQITKGHIVATRFATEATPRVKSKIFAEDPASPGDEPLREAPGLGAAVVALHYASIAAKIRQPILSAALASGVTVPVEIQFPAVVWEFVAGPLVGKRFVGGFFPGNADGDIAHYTLKNGSILLKQNTLRLDIGPGTFFGVAEEVFQTLCTMARSGDPIASQLAQYPDIPFFYSGASLLRDGTLIVPLDFMRPVEQINF